MGDRAQMRLTAADRQAIKDAIDVATEMQRAIFCTALSSYLLAGDETWTYAGRTIEDAFRFSMYISGIEWPWPED